MGCFLAKVTAARDPLPTVLPFRICIRKCVENYSTKARIRKGHLTSVLTLSGSIHSKDMGKSSALLVICRWIRGRERFLLPLAGQGLLFLFGRLAKYFIFLRD